MSEPVEAQNAVDHEEKTEEKEPVDEVKEEKDDVKEEASPKEEDTAEESMVADTSANAEKSEDANAGDDEASGSDSEDSLPPGLLERPIEILEQKRARKKITRFTYDDEKASPSVDKKGIEIPKGSGIRLGSHPRVEYHLQRNTAEDLKIIHKFFFGAFGSSHSVKKNLREFCGFVMEKDSPQYQKKEEFIGKFTVDNLKWAMTVCDVPLVKGNKDDLIDAFMEWCLCPKPQNKAVPGKRRKPNTDEKRKKKVKRSAKQMENGDSTSDVTPTKKGRKKFDKKSSLDKKAKIRITSPKSKVKVESDVTDTSDDEPLVQKKKIPPTNTEIRKYVENLLKDADLEVMTMKVVFQQVYEQYPEFDLTDRKPFIKETVKRIIS